MLANDPAPPALTARQRLRRQLMDDRARFASGAEIAAAQAALEVHLKGVLAELEPEILGVYWPIQGEFNAPAAFADDPSSARLPLALPFCQRTPRQMHYRTWDRGALASRDECGIAVSDGAPVVPDVVLAPCVGFTALGYRLGYGGGYFDRWLAAHPDVTAVGVAWSIGEMGAGAFLPEPHDRPLMLIVTERGVVA